MYKKAEASFWTAEEIDLIHDHKVCFVAPRTHGRNFMRVVLGAPPYTPSPNHHEHSAQRARRT